MLMSPNEPNSPVNTNDACMSIINSLLCYRQGGENLNFGRKAIESLVKKLKEKPEELDNLITAVTSNGTQIAGCVTIPRTLDGRLQIAGRKCFPHVVYARIWRWPNLHKNELRLNKYCEFGYEMKLDYVCINPYHYDRVVASAVDIAELSLTSSVEDLDDGVTSPQQDDIMSMDKMKYLPNCFNQEDNLSPRARMNLRYGQNDTNNTSNHQSHNNLSDSSGSPNEQSHHFNSTSGTTIADAFKVVNLTGDKDSCQQQQHHQQQTQHLHISSNNTNNNNNHFSNTSMSSANISSNNNSYSQNTHNSSNNNNPNSNITSNPWNNSNASNNSSSFEQRSSTSSMTPLSVLTHQKPPEFWCTIAYFELNQQVGEIFKVPSQYSTVTVDGYTDPSSPNRFCLGQLSNVHRSESSEKSRLYIGKGVELNNIGEGDVWIRCLSSHSVFVQSYYLDREAGRQPGDAVHKIYPGAFIKVFDIRQCHQQMRKASQEAQLAWVRQAAVVAGSSSAVVGSQVPSSQSGASSSTSILAGGNSSNMSDTVVVPPGAAAAAAGIGVDDLSPFCVLRLSFVKGWGPDYPRHSIKETPCWIEIKLNRPMQLLDEVLQSMSVNEYKPTRHFFNYYSNNNNNNNTTITSTSNMPSSSNIQGASASSITSNSSLLPSSSSAQLYHLS